MKGRRIHICNVDSTGVGVGIRFVQGLVKDEKLEIPKQSILGRQLGKMTKEALLDVNRHEFYAVQGLVNAVKYFFEQPVVIAEIVRSGYRYN